MARFVMMKEYKLEPYLQPPRKKVGGARPGAGRKDPRNGVRRNYQFDYTTIAMLDSLFPVPHAKRLLKSGEYKTRSRCINDAVSAWCEAELGLTEPNKRN